MLHLHSEPNGLLFPPMLGEVAGSTLEPSHISTPLRSSLRRTEFIRGRVDAIDLENRKVVLASDSPTGDLVVPYDHLVLALGSVSNYLGMANIEKLAFNFKSLLDAIRIRNHVIEMFERADREPDASQRVPFLSFVLAGGGFAGAELAGALNDFARGILADYPNLNPSELSIVLVHSRDRVLPHFSRPPTAQEFSFQFIGSTVRGRPSDRLRRIERPFCPEQVRAFLGIAGMADVAGNLSLEIARDGEKDSRTDGLDDRAFLPTRHRADD